MNEYSLAKVQFLFFKYTKVQIIPHLTKDAGLILRVFSRRFMFAVAKCDRKTSKIAICDLKESLITFCDRFLCFSYLFSLSLINLLFGCKSNTFLPINNQKAGKHYVALYILP